MTHPKFPQPTATTFSLADLVEFARAGRIRIPKFQRPLRWKWEDVRRLFDSISKGYPVGSLLLWKRPADAGQFQLGALDIKSGSHAESLWVVDGQQRLTSLASALSEEGIVSPEFSLAYDLDREDFVHLPKVEEATIIPLPVLFDLERLVEWAQEYSLGTRLKEASAVTKAIREFRIPAYIVEQQDEAVLRDIFDRMNNYGKRLSRAEVFAALHPGSEDSDQSAGFGRIIAEIDSELHFGQCDDDTVLRAVLARRGPDVTREIRDEFGKARANRDFGGESEEDAYREGGEALKRAVLFLQEVGVPHLSLLPYRYLLIVLTRFFAHFPVPDPRNHQLLRRWFWRAALIPPNAFGGWNPAMRLLGSQITSEDESGSVQRLLKELDGKKASYATPNLKKFRTNQADSRVALCALWTLEPRSTDDRTPYSRGELSSQLEADTTPREAIASLLSPLPKEMTAWLSGRHFLLFNQPGRRGATLFDFNHEVTFLDSDPGTGTFAELLASHAMNEELLEILREIEKAPKGALPERVQFLEMRHILVERIVDDFVLRSTEWAFEDTPPLANLDLDEDEDHDHELFG